MTHPQIDHAFIAPSTPVIPAQAGIQAEVAGEDLLDSRLRGNDEGKDSRLRGNDGAGARRLVR